MLSAGLYLDRNNPLNIPISHHAPSCLTHEKSTCLCNQADAFSYIDFLSLKMSIILRESYSS
nr:MAG TPA: hypothetical protein [Caudoviricetes sp.]